MNEQACAFVSLIYFLLGTILCAYWIKTGNSSISLVVSIFSLISCLTSALVAVFRYG